MTKASPCASAPPAAETRTIGDSEVPWRYTTLEDEYRALRDRSGALDLSSVGVIAVEGDYSGEFLGRLFTREIDFLSPETSITGLLLAEDAAPLDVVTVMKTDDGFLLITSVGRGTTTFEHLQAQVEPDDEVTVDDRSGDSVVLGWEGTKSWDVAESFVDEPITGLPFQGVRSVNVDGVPATIVRTGYTGEFGFQAIVPADAAASLWAKLTGLATPAGHEALEVAMVEVRQPILHREVDPEGDVVSAGLNWMVDLEKDEFLGRDALIELRDAAPEVLPVGFVTDVDVTRVAAGAAIRARDVEIGRIVHAVHSPDLGACGIARLRADVAASMLTVAFDTTDGVAELRTVSAPARVPTSWSAMLGAISEPTVGP